MTAEQVAPMIMTGSLVFLYVGAVIFMLYVRREMHRNKRK